MQICRALPQQTFLIVEEEAHELFSYRNAQRLNLKSWSLKVNDNIS